MGFAAGFQAGSGAVTRGLEMGERRDRKKREDEELARQDEARKAYHQLQQDYYAGTGEFAPQGAPADPQAAQMADASYDRVEARRLGIQPPPDAAQPPMADSSGAMQPRGLSLTPQQTKGLAPQPLDPAAKDRLYYKKLAEWGQTHLDPEKATAFMGDVAKLQETNYQQKRLEAFRAASSGDRAGLDTIAKLVDDMIPGDDPVDTSGAKFDPQKGWSGIKVGDQVVDLDDETMAGLFMRSDPAQLLEFKFKMGAEKRAENADTRAGNQDRREDRGLQLRENADVRAGNADRRADVELGLRENQDARDERLTGARIRGIDADIRQGDTRLRHDAARLGHEAQRIKLTRESLDIDRQRVQLQNRAQAGEEAARDILTRQTTFLNAFGGATKLDPDSPTYEEDRAELEARRQYAGLATSIYGMSAEGAKPEQRNAIAAETQQFIFALDSGKVDLKRVKDNGDGTATYGRIRFPSSLIEQAQAAPDAAAEEPATKKGVKQPKKKGEKKPKGVTAPSVNELENVNPTLGFAP